jgi:hypothetical protein
MSEANDEPPAALSGGVKTDAEVFIRPTYNAGGASGAMRRRNFHRWDTNETFIALISQVFEKTVISCAVSCC